MHATIKITNEPVTMSTLTHVDPTCTYTTVKVALDKWTGVGVARRNPRDEYDEAAGYSIALGRALRNLSDHFDYVRS